MEELQDASIHHMTAKVIAALKNSKCYEPIYEDLQRLVASPNVDKHDIRNTLEDAIKTAGLETELRNMIYNLVRSRLERLDSKQSIVSRTHSQFEARSKIIKCLCRNPAKVIRWAT